MTPLKKNTDAAKSALHREGGKGEGNGGDAMTFEQSMKKLEGIVSALEGGDLPLEKSLDAFEEGMEIAKVCESKLNEASARVEKIMKDLGGVEKRAVIDDDAAESLERDDDTADDGGVDDE